MSAKLYFKYGTMGSGKSMDLIRTYYNYVERGMRAAVFKSGIDTRDGKMSKVASRAGMEIDAIPFFDTRQIEQKIDQAKLDVVLFDECQFLKPEQIDEMQRLSYFYGIPFIFYGLKVDFMSNLFPASKRLIELADDIQQCIGICECGKKAQQNLRLNDGEPVFDGEQIMIGGNESYVAVCNKCYYQYKNAHK